MTSLTLLDDLARSSASPDAVRLVVEQLGAADGAATDRFGADEPLARAVIAVAGASRSLARVLVTDPDALEVLGGIGQTPGVGLGSTLAAFDPAAAGDADELARRKRLVLLAIAARDLLGLDDLEQVGASLARLADHVLAGALRLAGDDGALSVIALGKHGAEELNYASDIDVVFVAADTRSADPAVAQRAVAIANGAFRVDTNLRPEGRSGALVRSLDSYVAYWERWAQPWEFQALLKARAAAGDAGLGAAFEAAAAEHLWDRRLGADELAELRTMKARAEQLVARQGLAGRELKRGRGGIRDIEFSVQLLQLVHGGRDPALRLRATLPALFELASAGYVSAGDAAALGLAYRFLRTVEHRLQLVEEAQVHTVPAEREARERLARVLGFRGSASERPDERLEVVLARYQSSGRAIHERLFFRPLLEAFAGNAGRLGPLAAEERLAAFGFRDADRTRQALAELTRGLTRSSRLMHQLLPLLLDWLSASPDPDQGLVGLRSLAGAPHRRDLLVTAFRESPESARRLCLLLGTSRRLGEIVALHPSLVAELDDDAALEPPDRARLAERALLAAAHGPDRLARPLRNLVEEETVKIAAHDLLHGDRLPETGHSLSDLADAAVAAALAAAGPTVPMAVVGMGSYGGGEIAYGSDLDVLLVYDGTGPDEVEEGERAAADLFRLLNGATPADRVVRIDAKLRPEGRDGPLARSLGAFERYHRRWGQTWERQALLRARPVAGDARVLATFASLAEAAVWSGPLGEEEEREIRRMKARVERERIPASEDAQFHFKLGKGALADVEWTTQLLQLRSGVRAENTLDALVRLTAAGAIEPADAEVLRAAYVFCAGARNRWHLVGNYLSGGVVGAGADALPRQQLHQSHLARSLGTTPAELREAYRRHTRRARRVVERVFYGLE